MGENIMFRKPHFFLLDKIDNFQVSHVTLLLPIDRILCLAIRAQGQNLRLGVWLALTKTKCKLVNWNVYTNWEIYEEHHDLYHSFISVPVEQRSVCTEHIHNQNAVKKTGPDSLKTVQILFSKNIFHSFFI